MSDAAKAAFEMALREAAQRVMLCLDQQLLPADRGVTAAAMRHGVMNGGKRMRAFLVMEGARIFNVPPGQADRAAAAIECVHAYSLVHDDLPAMDDDDLRRGKPTVHVEWDEATAILAGDALQTLAFEILAAPQTAPDTAVRLKLISKLAQAAGAEGMVGGQALDMAAESADVPLDLAAITELQARKTGALIRWSAEAGPMLSKANISAMTEYSAHLGLAFQIRDDILDVEGDAAATGKAVGKDKGAGKATFVSLLGLDGAKAEAARLADAACDAVAAYGSVAENLRQAALFVVTRDR